MMLVRGATPLAQVRRATAAPPWHTDAVEWGRPHHHFNGPRLFFAAELKCNSLCTLQIGPRPDLHLANRSDDCCPTAAIQRTDFTHKLQSGPLWHVA
jgi:hypothetical protein